MGDIGESSDGRRLSRNLEWLRVVSVKSLRGTTINTSPYLLLSNSKPKSHSKFI